MDLEQKEVMTTQEIKDIGLEPTPKFYTSLTDNPVQELVGADVSVYNDILRLEKVIRSEVTVPAAVFDFMLMTTVPGSFTLTERHLVTESIPYVQIYVPTILESVVIPNATTDALEYESDILNYSFGDVTFTVEAYIYIVRRR